MDDLTINKSIFIQTHPDDVFSVLTSPEHMVRYFPIKKVTSSWLEGSEILLEGEHNGVEFKDYGIITSLNRPIHFSYSYWSTNHGTERAPRNRQTISYRLRAEKSGTRLTVTQSNIRSAESHRIMSSMWDTLLANLSAYAASQRRPA